MDDLSPEELPLLDLMRQLMCSNGDSAGAAARLMILLPDGSFVGDVVLTKLGIDRVTKALADQENGWGIQDAVIALPRPLPQPHDDDIDGMVTALENLANGELG